MADHEFTLTALSVRVVSSGEDMARKVTVTVNFTKAGDTFKVTLPEMLHDNVRQILSQFMRDISVETHAAVLTESDNFITNLL